MGEHEKMSEYDKNKMGEQDNETGERMKKESKDFPFGKELKRRTTRRAKFKDYRDPGFYMITITARKETPRFCRIFNSADTGVTDNNLVEAGENFSESGMHASETGVNSSEAGEVAPGGSRTGKILPKVEYTSLGRIVAEKIMSMPIFTPQLEIVKYVVMPDHLHILIHIKTRLERHLGKIIGGFMGGCTTAARKGRLIRAEASLFTEKFHDRLVSRIGQMKCLKNYIADNPRRLLIKREHPDLFKKYLHLRIGEREYAAYGNIFLLRHFDLFPVRIHRRWSESEFDSYEAECFARIDNGAVAVSPFIHTREKRIRDKAIESGGSLIIIRDMGFEERFSPKGLLFRLCEEGRLLLLAPWQENTGRNSDAGSREFHSMNDMAKEISSLSGDVRMEIVNGAR